MNVFILLPALSANFYQVKYNTWQNIMYVLLSFDILNFNPVWIQFLLHLKNKTTF